MQIVWGRRRCHALSVVRVQRWLHINIEERWSAAVVKAVASLLTEMVQTPNVNNVKGKAGFHVRVANHEG